MPEPLADVVPLCRAVRHDDLPGVHCPHCAPPVEHDGPAPVLWLPPHRPGGTDRRLSREL